jgi:hypothetical protein
LYGYIECRILIDAHINQILLRIGTMPTRKKKAVVATATTKAVATNWGLIDGVHDGAPLHRLQLQPPEH